MKIGNQFRKYRIANFLILTLATAVAAGSLLKFINNFAVSLQPSGSSDSTIYWAVGRGILNGIAPYSGLFESKPPGMFLLSALSLKVTGDFLATFLFGSLTISALALTLPIFVWLLSDFMPMSKRMAITLVSCVFSPIVQEVMLNLAGGFQTEGIGAVFCCLYFIVLIKYRNQDRNQFDRIAAYSLSAFFIFLAFNFKEPFALICVAGALIVLSRAGQITRLLVVPTCVAIILFLIELKLLGALDGYREFQLGYIFGTYLWEVNVAPVWWRALWLYLPYRTLLETSGILFSCVFLALATLVSHAENHWKSWRDIFSSLSGCPERPIPLSIRLLLAFALISIALSLHNRSQHLAFPVPIYLLVTALGLTQSFKEASSRLTPLQALWLVPMLFSASTINFQWPVKPELTRLITPPPHENDIRLFAKSFDQSLTRCGLSSYLYWGPIDIFYALTEHSPRGPVFFQIDSFLANDLLRTRFIAALQSEEILLRKKDIYASRDEIKLLFERRFDRIVPSCFGELVIPDSYEVFFSRNLSTLE